MLLKKFMSPRACTLMKSILKLSSARCQIKSGLNLRATQYYFPEKSLIKPGLKKKTPESWQKVENRQQPELLYLVSQGLHYKLKASCQLLHSLKQQQSSLKLQPPVKS